jgi:hypothetical protein
LIINLELFFLDPISGLAMPSSLLLLLLCAGAAHALTTQWACTPSLSPATPTAPLPAGLTFAQLVCTSSAIPLFGRSGPINVSVVAVDLTRPALRLVPVANASLAQLDAMAAALPARRLWAGINGGYFWRLDSKSFLDGVCLGKSRAEALLPPSLSAPNQGVGDGAVVAGGVLLAASCNCVGYSRPALLSINGSASRIDVQGRGAVPLFGTALDSLAAGPNLVSVNASGPYLDIPADDDNIGNILEHSANTALGLLANGTALLVTVDGFDGCSGLDATCCTNAFTLAYLMKDFFGVASALGMDQGGSTSMFVRGAGIVSNPGQGVRVFSVRCFCGGGGIGNLRLLLHTELQESHAKVTPFLPPKLQHQALLSRACKCWRCPRPRRRTSCWERLRCALQHPAQPPTSKRCCWGTLCPALPAPSCTGW